MGPGARAARLHLDHQGPPRGVGAAGRLRAQPPQGAAPGGADLARRQRLHAGALAARLAPQPPRVRRSRDRVRAHPARPPRRLAGAACARLLDARELARRPEQRVLIHHEEFGERLLGVLAGYLLYAFPEQFTSGPNAVVAIEKITGRQLGAAGREIVAVTVDEGSSQPCRKALPDMGLRDASSIDGPARARRARRAPRGADAPAAVRGRRRAARRPDRGERVRRRSTTPSTTARCARRSAAS